MPSVSMLPSVKSLPGLTAGDVVPLSFRRLKYINTIAAATASLLLASMLFYVIFTKSNSQLKKYRSVLLISIVADLFLAFSFFGFSNVMFTIDNTYFMVTEGVFGSFIPEPLSFYCLWSVFFSAYLFFCVTPVQYVYRAVLVIKNRELGPGSMTMLAATSTIVAGGVSFAYVRHFYPTPEMKQKYDRYFNHPDWLASDGRLPSYGAFSVQDLTTTMLLYPAMFGVGYLVIIACSVLIVTKTRSSVQPASQSSSARKVARQITIVLIVQTLIPFLAVVMPITLDCMTIAGWIYIPQAGYIATFAVAWAPIFNPVITLTAIKHYRNTVVNMIGLTVCRRRLVNQTQLGTSSKQNHSHGHQQFHVR